MPVTWTVVGSVSLLGVVAVLGFLGLASWRAWHANRPRPSLDRHFTPAQVRWANTQRRADDLEATLIIPVGDPDYVRPVNWQELRTRGRPWPFQTGAAAAGSSANHHGKTSERQPISRSGRAGR